MSLVFMNDEELQQQQVVMMKTCTTCKKTKPATPEYFHRQKTGKYGLISQCKECSNKSRKAWYQNGGKEKTRNRYQNGGYEKWQRQRHEKSPHRAAFNELRKSVKRKGKYKFLLGEAKTPEAEAYIKYLQTITHCPDCLKELVWYSEGGKKNESASFDRIDSNGNYTKENVRIVCFCCNRKKSDHPVDEWVGLLKVRVEKGIIEQVDQKLTEFLCETPLYCVKS
jgi:hypothetical protein